MNSNSRPHSEALNLLRFPLALVVVLVHVVGAGIPNRESYMETSPLFAEVLNFIKAFLSGQSVPIYFLIVLMSYLCVLSAHAQRVDMDALWNINIPVLRITTQNGEEPTCDYVHSPSGRSRSIANAVQVPGRMVITQKRDTLYDSGQYAEGKSGMTIKIRGNTSAYTPKKPFKLKLQKKADLLFRDSKDYRDKNWVLLKMGNTLNTAIGNFVNEKTGLRWTPRYQFVNLVINDDYRGLYYLSENVRKSSTRINVDDTGYIFEYDAYYWKDSLYVKSLFAGNMGYTLKYPEPEEISPAAYTYFQSMISQMERAMIYARYDEVLNVETFARWILAHDILGTQDAFGSNLYFTKYDSTSNSKIEMANLWDFDSILQTSYDAWGTSHTSGAFFPYYMFRKGDSMLRYYYYSWQQLLRGDFFLELKNFLDSFLSPLVCADMDKCRQMDAIRWEKTYKSLSQEVANAKQYFSSREAWLTDTIASMGANLVPMKGDVNNDGVLTIDDVTLLMDFYLKANDQEEYTDIDNDGKLTISDITELISMYLNQ